MKQHKRLSDKNVRRSHASRALVAALAIFALGASAKVVEIMWSENGSFNRTVEVPSLKSTEVCGKLPAGENVHWRFDGNAPLDFNVHYHEGKSVVFPSKLLATASAEGTLTTKIDQDYCWMWSNKSAKGVSIAITLQRPG